MPGQLRELGANLYLIPSGRPNPSHCVIMASYAGSKTCKSFTVPSTMSLFFFPFDIQSSQSTMTAARWEEQAALTGVFAYGSRIAALMAQMSQDNWEGRRAPTIREAGNSASNPLLRKYDSAHEAAYHKDANDEVEQIDYYDLLTEEVEKLDKETAQLHSNARALGRATPAKGGYDIIAVRNRKLHGGVTLFDAIAEEKYHRPSVTNFLITFADPAVRSMGGGWL